MVPERIVLHHSLTQDSGTVSWGAIRRYHTQVRGWRDIGYHFGIELVGDSYEVLLGRWWDTVGAHVRGHNMGSLGVCLVGNFSTEPPSAAEWRKAVELAARLCATFGLAPKYVFGHRELQKGRSCPGEAFDLEKFRHDVWTLLRDKWQQRR